jgi:hypothetical protein
MISSAPHATPTPIPIFAPSDRPDGCEPCDGLGLDVGVGVRAASGREDAVAEGVVMTAEDMVVAVGVAVAVVVFGAGRMLWSDCA